MATMQAAILAESRAPLVIDEVEMPAELGVGQVHVQVLYSGICGAQINEVDAVKGEDKWLPHLLGHEGVARVVAIGPGVSTVKPGDRVVMHWRPSAGIQASPAKYLWRGKTLNAGWVTTFNSAAIVSENRLTVVPEDLDARVAPLLGCAVTTAMGVVNHDARLGLGQSVVVLGVGGVGLNIVQMAALAGGEPIIAVDVHDHKVDMARTYGAAHGFNGRTTPDMDAAIRAIVGPKGADVVVDTTGNPRMIEMAYGLTHPSGRTVLVGVPSGKVTIHTLPIHFDQVLTGSHGGNSVPDRDIPRLIKLINAGKLSLADLVTHEFALADINDALALFRSGTAGRILIKMPDS